MIYNIDGRNFNLKRIGMISTPNVVSEARPNSDWFFVIDEYTYMYKNKEKCMEMFTPLMKAWKKMINDDN